jgi:hypothetical protein
MVQASSTSQVSADLIRRSQAARERLSVDIAEFKHRIDVPSRIRNSLNANPAGWIGGGLVAGLLASLAMRRQKPAPEKKRIGFSGLALTAAGALARPLLKAWLTGKLTHAVSARQDDDSQMR